MSIVLEHLTKRYEGHPVVNNTSLEIANGEFFVLLGPSGSGKSTVLRMIAGLAAIDQGQVLLNGAIDLPFAIPTLVTGVTLVVLYGPQSALGVWLDSELGRRIIFAPPGIILALLFVAFPFVVRTVQPMLESLDRDQEEAAATLGAGAWTIFHRVTLPPLVRPLISGTLLSFARAIGEFGAIVIVAGNLPLRSQTAAVYVFGEIEAGNQHDASAVSVVMLAIAFGLMMLVDYLQPRRAGQVAEEPQ